MIEPPTIVFTEPLETAYIHVVTPRAEIQHVMGPTVRELFAGLSSQAIAPAGAWFTHHTRRPDDVFDFEASVPVASPVTASGRLRPGKWPATEVVRTIYHGPYEGLAEAWAQFHGWIEMQGLQTREDLYERYLVGPEMSSDPTEWRTELNRPLKA